MTDQPKISCRHLWKVFGTDPQGFLARHGNAPTPENFAAERHIGAVRDVSFDVYPGEILIIMGLSGSGKSTLIRAITRLNDPTAGEVVFEGRDFLKASPAELIEIRRHKMGMVFQHFGLLPHRTVLSNVAFPLEVRGATREERDTRAREMIRLVGLEGRENYFPRELSGGQQQRVAVARALANRPRAVLADEPTASIDSAHQQQVIDLLRDSCREQGAALLVVTHAPEVACQFPRRLKLEDFNRAARAPARPA